MKTRVTFTAVGVLMFALAAASSAWAQYTATIQGKVTDGGKPLAGVQVIYTNANNGRQIKLKTNSKGEYSSIGVPFDTYDVSVMDSSGKAIYSHKGLPVGQSGGDNRTEWNIDITEGGSGKTAGGAGGGTLGQAAPTDKGKSTQPQLSKEEIEKIKAQNSKAENINALIAQYQAAVTAKDWKAAIPPLQGMTAADPTRWEYFQALGNMQLNDGQYEEATQSYDKGIQVAQGYVSGTTPKDPKNANSDPAKAKVGMGQMLTNEGNAYLKLKKNPEAIAAFTKAAELDPNPGTAYFNLCATQYNSGNTEGALAACDKAIAADPNRADAYFIKGSLLIASSTADKEGKISAPPGTAEALNKYLELAPDGAHAPDVKQMLQYIGSKIETTYKKKGK
jgi:tetratricopeptide (TPR) repeat protein